LIAVVGGTGTLGSAVVEELLGRGESVRILSRNRPQSLAPGSEHIEFDLSAEDGGRTSAFGEALNGARTVIDAANNPVRPGPVMLEGSGRLIDACGPAGVEHFVGVSIVGCEKVGLGYYRAKARQEGLVRESPIGWSLLRATQFHELIDGAFTAAARFRLLPGGSAPLQPVAAATVAAELALIATGEPLNDATQLVGPERQTLGDLAAEWKSATGRRGLRVPVPLIGRTVRAIAAGAFADGSATGAGPGFATWLAARYGSSGE